LALAEAVDPPLPAVLLVPPLLQAAAARAVAAASATVPSIRFLRMMIDLLTTSAHGGQRQAPHAAGPAHAARLSGRCVSENFRKFLSSFRCAVILRFRLNRVKTAFPAVTDMSPSAKIAVILACCPQ
jgi:hypothetical protein